MSELTPTIPDLNSVQESISNSTNSDKFEFTAIEFRIEFRETEIEERRREKGRWPPERFEKKGNVPRRFDSNFGEANFGSQHQSA